MASEIEVTGLKHALREIRMFDKTLVFKLRSRMRAATAEDRAKVSRVISEVTPMLRSVRQIGMFHNGRTAWNEATVDIDRMTGRNVLIAIRATGRGRKFGFDYAELTGINPPRTGGISRQFKRANSDKTMTIKQRGQGRAFEEMLNDNLPANHTAKPGRYAFQALVRRMPYIQKKVIRVIQEFADETSYRIETKDN
jgi:hypothetical protein